MKFTKIRNHLGFSVQPLRLLPVDLDGQPRIVNGSVDMGVYEAASVLPRATATPTITPTNTRSPIDRYLPLIYR